MRRFRNAILAVILMVVFIIIIPIMINEAYNHNTIVYITDWEAKDVLVFYGSILTFLGTLSLGALSLFQNRKFEEANGENQKEIQKIYIEANEQNILRTFIEIENKRIDDITSSINEFLEVCDLNSISMEINAHNKLIYNLSEQLEDEKTSADLEYAKLGFLASLFNYRNRVLSIDLQLMNQMLLDRTTEKSLIEQLNNSRLSKLGECIRFLDTYIDKYKNHQEIQTIHANEKDYSQIRHRYMASKENYLAARNQFLNELIYGNVSLDKLKEISTMTKNKNPLPSWNENIPREQYRNFKEIQTDSDWFKVYELPNDIIAIYEPCHVQESISYLIMGSSTCLLWDTGLGMFDIKSVVDSLTDKPIIVVNSHYHFDHIGGNRYFSQVHVLNHEIITNRLKKGVTAIDVEQGFMKESTDYQGKIPFDIESYSIPPTNNFSTIEDGHVFDLGNRKFKVIHTPIHSPESIILVSDDEKIVFTGDTIHPINTCVHHGFSPLNDEIINCMDKFAERYANYQLYCSHIEPMQEGNRLLDIAKAFHQIKENDLTYQIDNDGFKRYGFDGFSVTVE